MMRTPQRHFARREAPLPPLTNPVEQAIRNAQKRGELTNLAGSGKPLSKNAVTTLSSHSLHASSGSSTSNILSTKAEFEMRRAAMNQELELEHLHGKARAYQGTNIVGSSGIGGGGPSSGAGGDLNSVMGDYILKESQPSVKDLKSLLLDEWHLHVENGMR